MTQIKEQDKFPENQLNYMETGNLPEKEFRIMTVNMIQDLGKRMEKTFEKMQEMFTKDKQELKNNHPTGTKTKPHFRKSVSMKKQKVISQLMGQDKTPEEQLNEVEYIQRSRKRIQNKDSKDDSGSWKKNRGKD